MPNMQTNEKALAQQKAPLHRIAVVVPMHNEAHNIARFAERLSRISERCASAIFLVYVDDGSTDNTLSVVKSQLDTLPGSVVVELSRNFGKEAAMLAGMDTALTMRFDALILIDADLQHPPEAIPEMIKKWTDGSDVVIAARKSRLGDSFARRMLSRCFYRIINRLADVEIADGEGDFRLLARGVVNALCSLREQDRFTKGLYSWVGFRQSRIFVEYDQRSSGSSRFSLSQLTALAGSAITSFSAKPLRLALYVGAVVGSLSLFLALWIGMQTVIFGRVLPGYTSIFCGLMFIGGVQLMSIGLLGEYVGRTYIQSKMRPPYVIRETTRGSD
jgi:glycosyltransferase involved in cell wall biosynthesis